MSLLACLSFTTTLRLLFQMPQCSSPCSDAVLYCEANSKGQLFLIADIHSFHFTLRFSCMAISFAFSASSSVFIEVLVLIPYTSTTFTVASKQLQDKLYSLKKKNFAMLSLLLYCNCSKQAKHGQFCTSNVRQAQKCMWGAKLQGVKTCGDQLLILSIIYDPLMLPDG